MQSLIDLTFSVYNVLKLIWLEKFMTGSNMSRLRTYILEPMIVLYIFSVWVVKGSGLNTTLLIYKVCQVEMNYNETICDNLDDHKDIQNMVQARVNRVQMISSWLGSIPSLCYSLFIGALSDDVGRKPVLFFPIFGQILGSLCDIINFIWIETLPTEFFYTEEFYSLFGGQAVYYLGYYGFGASVSTLENRAALLARYDGLEQGGMLLGTLLSPVVFNSLGYLGCYCVKFVALVFAILYLVIFVREPVKRQKKDETTESDDYHQAGLIQRVFLRLASFVHRFLFTPFYQMVKTVFQKRQQHLRSLLFIQLFVYAMYWFLIDQNQLMQLYLLNVMPGFNSNDYSHYLAFMKVVSMIGLLGILPLLSSYLHWHDGIVLTIIAFTFSLGHLIMAFAQKMWQVYVCEAISMLRIGQFSVARSMFTRCIYEDEIGKLYSGIAFLAAIVPIVSNGAFRGLYDLTLDTFPSAFLLLAAALGTLCTFLNFFVYTQKHRMLTDTNPKSKLVFPMRAQTSAFFHQDQEKSTSL